VSFFIFDQWIYSTRQKYNRTIDSWVIWQVHTLAFPCIAVWSLYNMTSIQLLVSVFVASTVRYCDYFNVQLYSCFHVSFRFSTSALMERLPSRWPKPVWHAPWKNYRVIVRHSCIIFHIVCYALQFWHPEDSYNIDDIYWLRGFVLNMDAALISILWTFITVKIVNPPYSSSAYVHGLDSLLENSWFSLATEYIIYFQIFIAVFLNVCRSSVATWDGCDL
jgi:hypothetical protein